MNLNPFGQRQLPNNVLNGLLGGQQPLAPQPPAVQPPPQNMTKAENYQWAKDQLNRLNQIHSQDDQRLNLLLAEIFQKIGQDLSRNVLPYGPRTCQLIGALFNNIQKKDKCVATRSGGMLLLSEYRVVRLHPEQMPLYDIIWKGTSFHRLPFDASGIEFLGQQVGTLYSLNRVRQHYLLRGCVLSDNQEIPFNEWLGEVAKLMSTKRFDQVQLNKLSKTFVLRLNNATVPLTP